MYANYQRNDGPNWVTVSGGYIFLPEYYADPEALGRAVQLETAHNRWHHRYCS